jgi:hypothetical protein
MIRSTTFVALTLFVSASCAEADRPRNPEGGRIWTYREVVAEGAENGTGVGPLDTCTDCCFPYVCTALCCNEPGGPGGTPGGGGGPSEDECMAVCSICPPEHANFCRKKCHRC